MSHSKVKKIVICKLNLISNLLTTDFMIDILENETKKISLKKSLVEDILIAFKKTIVMNLSVKIM